LGLKLYQQEVRVYQILGMNGTPHTLQLQPCSTSQLTLKLKYQPNVGQYHPKTMAKLKQYTQQVLKVPACSGNCKYSVPLYYKHNVSKQALQYIHMMQLVPISSPTIYWCVQQHQKVSD
jgi:hypothetical protein